MENEKKRISGIVYVIVSVVVVAAIATGIVLWKNSEKPGSSSNGVTATVTPTPTAELTPTATPTAEPTNTPTPTGSEENRELVTITFSGNRDDHVITDRYGVYEGERFFLFLDKDLDIPGDFGDNIELIMKTLEQEIGFTFESVGRRGHMWFETDQFEGKDPWRNFDNGTKLVIYVLADRTDEHLISFATDSGAVFVLYELFSDELWNSVDSYRDNPWRRDEDVQYETIAHELTHSLTSLYYDGITRIMTEGSAEYYAERTLTALKDHSKEFEERYNLTKSMNEYWIDEKVTKENAEALFTDDYRDLSHADRGDEYTFGRVFCEFLGETYGDTFMEKYLKAAKERGLGSQYCSTNNTVEPEKHTALMKELFGDDVFVRFAEWLGGNYGDGVSGSFT
ncbi:MAG: hypothetical protein IK055_04405 [Lachnospiraceae bacterium]|nr:hypothetical protein [Lachnospiraceae bacterium]